MTETVPFHTIVKFTLITMVVLSILAYVIFQARHLIVGPQIVLSDDLGLLQNKRKVFLSGSAYNISRLWLNDRQIYTSAQGNFKEAIILENGYTIVTLKAEDRYGRLAIVTHPFVYSPTSFIR